jgi:hypothetical protein
MYKFAYAVACRGTQLLEFPLANFVIVQSTLAFWLSLTIYYHTYSCLSHAASMENTLYRTTAEGVMLEGIVTNGGERLKGAR